MKYPVDMKYICVYYGINFILFLLCKNFIISNYFILLAIFHKCNRQ